MKKAAKKSNQVGKMSGGGCYKKGGRAKSKKKDVKVEGAKAAPRLDKYARGGHVKKGHKTQVNVIVGAGKQPVPVPVPPMAPPMGAPVPPMQPPGMKTGGKVPHMTAGAMSAKGRLQKVDIQKSKK